MEFNINPKLEVKKLPRVTNQQRKALSEQIKEQAVKQIDALRKSIPECPSLRNYIVSCFLNGTAVQKQGEYTTQMITEKLKRSGNYGTINGEDITIPLEWLYEIPEG